MEEYTWAAPEMKINGVGGNVDTIRGIFVKIHSVKHGTTVPATFYLADQLGCNILSESLVYDAMTDQVVKFVSKVKIKNF